MTAAHDDPAIAAARTFSADLPLLAGEPGLPADAGPRTKLLEQALANASSAHNLLIDSLRATARDSRRSTAIATRPSSMLGAPSRSRG